jgi:hypothetical protein
MVAAALLDRVQQGDVENVVVLYRRTNGGFCCDYSALNTTDILMHEKAIQALAMDHYRASDA